MSLVDVQQTITANLKLSPEQTQTLYQFFEKCFEVTQVYGDANEEDSEPEKKLEMNGDELILISRLQKALYSTGLVTNT